jgi:hypothetical protein
MKITYSKGYTPYPKLRSLGIGDVFRPKNSQKVYITTMYIGTDDIFSDTACENYIENIQNFDLDNTKDFRACVDLSNGTMVFFHLDIEVRELECELNIIEEE